MCGIVGIWSPSGDYSRLRAELDAGVVALRHRGPDDSGTWTNGAGVALGHTRLSIIDLSTFGHQPMVSPDGRHAIVFNGEIYNFAEIRSRLESMGHVFSGTGDTEVILHAFIEWGTDAVKHFIGMFAIAYWNQQEQTLELLRDRIGVKPLYFGWHAGVLCFASELKALYAFRHWKPEIEPGALGEYLQYGYIAGDSSIFKGIFKLSPGHRLKLRRGEQLQIERYWSVEDSMKEPLCGTDDEIESQLENLLIDAFRYRMVADVPVGVFLSGGVDSSLLAALLSRHHGRLIRTFTIGFAESEHDESRWARRVAEHCGTDHTEYVLGVREALSIAENWGALFDEPFGDSSGVPTLLVSRLARQQVKVALSADGGDELFSGYGVYASVLRRLSTVARLPSRTRHMCGETLAALRVGRFDNGFARMAMSAAMYGDFSRKVGRLRMMLPADCPEEMMNAYTSYWYPDEIRHLIGGYVPAFGRQRIYSGSTVDRVSLRDLHTYLPEDILTKVDRTTMAVGLEGREPLLDHRLAEFAFRLPPHLRRGSLGSKHILKSILYRYIPRGLVDRPKQGFSIPLEAWLRGGLRELMHDSLSEQRIRHAGVMDARMVRSLVEQFEAGNGQLANILWLVLAFEMWRDKWHKC